ncbi:MAG: hypothetical protein J4469_00675 [Candidatus Aenigmarchaeota archaeon]|nr:hypothetical protein [Candidatus Aenigmarchaeota archaeon]
MPEIYDPAKPFNDQVRRLIGKTHRDGPVFVIPHEKRFKRVNDPRWNDYFSQDAVDGIGTKGLLHWQMDTLEYGVQDAFAMVVDDLMEGNYVPVSLQDHILIQEENHEKIFRMVGTLADLCKEHGIAITAGETAIINALQGFEMGITAQGYCRKGEEITPRTRPGDVVIGLGSSGIHSNGLSFYRQELFDKRGMTLETPLPWGATVGGELTIPTHVYMTALKDMIKYMREDIHGMVHITGGGLSKLRELAPERDVDIEVGRTHRLEPQEIFRFAYELDPSSEKMYTRFNNGVGYAVAVPQGRAEQALETLRKHFPAEQIGAVNRGTGRISIESQYDGSTVVY